MGFRPAVAVVGLQRGRPSAVAAGAVAKQLLHRATGTEVLAWVKRIHTIEAVVDASTVQHEAIESNIVRCPDPDGRPR